MKKQKKGKRCCCFWPFSHWICTWLQPLCIWGGSASSPVLYFSALTLPYPCDIFALCSISAIIFLVHLCLL